MSVYPIYNRVDWLLWRGEEETELRVPLARTSRISIDILGSEKSPIAFHLPPVGKAFGAGIPPKILVQGHSMKTWPGVL